MRILGSSPEPSWFFLGRERSRLRNIDMCATRSGPLSRTARRTLNHIESSLLQTRNQHPPWNEGINKASPSIVILRTVTVYRLKRFCVDFKIINTNSISISILHCIMLCCDMLCCVVLCCDECCVLLYCVVSCCIVLCCDVFYYTGLHYIAL